MMKMKGRQSIDKKRSVIELLDSSDEEDDLLKDTGKIFSSSKKKTKSPDGPERVGSSNNPYPIESFSTPILVGSTSRSTPEFVGSSGSKAISIVSSSSSRSRNKPVQVDRSPFAIPQEATSSAITTPQPEAIGSSRSLPQSVGCTPTKPSQVNEEPSVEVLSPDLKRTVLNNRTQLGYFTAPAQMFEGVSASLVSGQGLLVVVEHEPRPYCAMSLRLDPSGIKVGTIPKVHETAILSLTKNHSNKLSVKCTVARCMPGIQVLVRLELDFKTFGPPTLNELIQVKSGTHSALHRFGWTEGIPPPIAYQPLNNCTKIAEPCKAAPIPSAPFEPNKQPILDNDIGNENENIAPSGLAPRGALEPLEVDMSEVEQSVDVERLDSIFEALQKVQLKDLPQVEMPKHLSSVQFYEYQTQGIKWLLKQELNDNIPPWFTKLPNGKWRCQISKCAQTKDPSSCRGSVLADDMGLGKTLQTLALFLLNPPKGQRGYPYVRQGMGGEYKPRTTLIVAPVSVMSNWIIQIKKHVNQSGKKNILSVAKYHGPNRQDKTSLVLFNQVDILITSYHTLATEIKKYNAEKENDVSLTAITKSRSKKKKTPSIFDLHFHRIVLDEAHIIRNAATGFFKACQNIHADHHLCLTGTPFVNKPDDIQSLLAFLKVQPLCSKKAFKKAVTERIQNRDPGGLGTLRATMAYIALRRTKANVISAIKLVTKTVEQRIVKFPVGSQHKIIHDVLYFTTRAAFIGFLNGKDNDGIKENYMAFIELVLRVRQACCHAGLVPAERVENAKSVREHLSNKSRKDIDPEQAEKILESLRGLEQEEDLGGECAICLELLDAESVAILKSCKHIFCRPCLEQNRTDLCPLCRGQYTEDDILSKLEVEESVQGAKSEPSLKSRKNALQYALSLGRHPKIQAMLDEVEKMQPDEKAVIFSQWTSHLDIIEQELLKEGHTYCRIDGTMSADARLESMERFDADGCDSFRTPRFILCSLMACGTGINLVRGNVVFLMDPWWNAAAEEQAMDRVHRIGQTRPVRVIRFLMEQSIETRMMALQDAKSALGKGSLQKLKPEEQRKARMMTLNQLLEVENVEDLWV